MSTPSRLSLIVAVFAFVIPSTTATAQRINRLADKAYDIGDFAQAESLYAKVLRKDPDDTEARLRYGYTLRILGRLQEAEEILSGLSDSRDPEVAYQHALTLTELGRYPEAVELVFRAAKLNHPKAEGLAARLTYAQAHVGDLAAWKVSNEFANTAGEEFAPETAGATVVFASDRDGDPLQLYRSTRDENQFLRVPQKLHKVGEMSGGDAPVAYSPSGELVAYTRNNFASGERLIPEAGWELSLLLALPTEDGDFLPGKTFAHNGSGFSSGFPSFSPDGKRLYFASDRPGGMGGYDIYYCERGASGWETPVNLGSEVNSPGNEIAPQTVSGSIYFSSDYLPGFGGMDIYRADIVGGVVGSVSNLGPAVNSPLDDVGFALTEDGSIAYLASNRAGGKGGMDLYRAVRSGQAITLAVIDGKTRQPIPNAVLDFSDCGEGIYLTGADGAYTFRALPTLNCRPMVKKAGYNAKQFSVVASSLKDKSRVEIVLNGEDKITVYEGKVVNSRTGDALDQVRIFARHKTRDFTADALTDARGNYTLSLERAGEYTIAYERSGMATIDREVSTYDGDGAGVLSTFAMFPDGSAVASAPSREMITGSTTDDAASAGVVISTEQAIDTPSENTNAYPASTYRTPTPAVEPSIAASGSATPGTVDAGFAIQVAALRSDATDISSYATRLSSVGPVYGRVEGPLLKVRVGPFSSRDTPVAQLLAVRSLGYGDAFLATEAGGSAIGSTLQSRGSAVTPRDAPTEYFVRLATFRSLANFDQSKAALLGDLTTRRSGDNVIVLLRGFADADAARQKLDEVQRAGYADAQVVQDPGDGSLSIVR